MSRTVTGNPADVRGHHDHGRALELLEAPHIETAEVKSPWIRTRKTDLQRLR